MRNAVYAKVGAIAGWLLLISLTITENIGPQNVAGDRVSGATSERVISSYFNHPSLQNFVPGQFLTVVFFVVFIAAIYELLSQEKSARFFARVGLVFAIAQLPLIMTKVAIWATLVNVATAGGETLHWFRFFDVLYNSGINLNEGALAAFFGLAMWQNRASFPRWTPYLGLIAGLLLTVNMTALFVGIPDNLTIFGHIALAIWILGGVIGLTRAARMPERTPVAQTS